MRNRVDQEKLWMVSFHFTVGMSVRASLSLNFPDCKKGMRSPLHKCMQVLTAQSVLVHVSLTHMVSPAPQKPS